MKTITFIKSSVLSLLLATTGNSAWAQIKVEDSTPKDEKVEYVYYTDGSSNFDYDRLWKDKNNERMQLDYCKAFIGQKILCFYLGDVQHSTYQIKDIEGGEFLVELSSKTEKGEKSSYPIHKIASCKIGQPMIYKTEDDAISKYGRPWVPWHWQPCLYNKKGEVIWQYKESTGWPYISSYYFPVTETKDDLEKFSNQFLLIKGVYTIDEAGKLIQESMKEIVPGKMCLPSLQKKLDKLEKKKLKGKLSQDEIEAYETLITRENIWYKNIFNEEEYYAIDLKGDTLIEEYDKLSTPSTGSQICLLVEDNQGQEYFITFRDGSGCITEKHFAHVREQYVSQYVTKTYHGEVTYPNGKRVGPTMKCEDIVLRNHKLQAKLRDVQTDEISYVELSYQQSSSSHESYSTEEEGSYFYLENYETIVPENI